MYILGSCYAKRRGALVARGVEFFGGSVAWQWGQTKVRVVCVKVKKRRRRGEERKEKRWAIVCGLLGVVCSGWISWSDDVVVIPFGRNYHIDGGRSPAVNV